MKIMNKLIGIFAIMAICGLVFISCPEGDGTDYEEITSAEQLYGTWKTDVTVSVKFEEALKDILAALYWECDCEDYNGECDCEDYNGECDCGFDLTINDIKTNIKGLIIGDDEIDFSDFIDYLVDELESELELDIDIKGILDEEGIDSWESLQSYVNSVLATSVEVKASVSIAIAEDEIEIFLNSASIKLSGGKASNIFSLMESYWELFEDEISEDIYDMIELKNNTISFKGPLSIMYDYEFEGITEDDIDAMNAMGVEISSDGKTLVISISSLIQDDDFTLPKWLPKSLTFKKQ